MASATSQPSAPALPDALSLIAPEDLRLRRRSQPVARVDARIRRLAEQLFALMRREQGVGLAAPQAGLLLRLIVVDVSRHQEGTAPLALVNPAVVARSRDTTVGTEGCLSLPGIEAPVRRARRVRVEALTMAGAAIVVEATGLLARALQHEIDHLNGILFIDRLSWTRRWRLRRLLASLPVRPLTAVSAGAVPTAL